MKCSRCGTEFTGNYCPQCGLEAPTGQNAVVIPQKEDKEERELLGIKDIALIVFGFLVLGVFVYSAASWVLEIIGRAAYAPIVVVFVVSALCVAAIDEDEEQSDEDITFKKWRALKTAVAGMISDNARKTVKWLLWALEFFSGAGIALIICDALNQLKLTFVMVALSAVDKLFSRIKFPLKLIGWAAKIGSTLIALFLLLSFLTFTVSERGT